MRNTTPVILATLAFCAAAACTTKKEAPLPESAAGTVVPAPASVSTMELGRHIGANKRVTDTTSTFGRRDTLYLAVVSENATAGTNLTATWTFTATGQVVDSTTQAVAPAEAGATTSVTEFHLTKPSGWPAGKYRVEVFLNGVSQGGKEFAVK